jgi:hypothetical protein
MVIYRFADAEKNPLRRQELSSVTFQPLSVVGTQSRWSRFELDLLLDSTGPGKNVRIGHGLGVAIEVEKTAEALLEWGPSPGKGPGGWASLCLGSAQMRFSSRTIDDKVVV